MVKFVIPVVYVLSVWAAVNYFGLSVHKFFSYQFYTEVGLKMFLVIISLNILSFAVMYVLNKPKYDF